MGGHQRIKYSHGRRMLKWEDIERLNIVMAGGSRMGGHQRIKRAQDKETPQLPQY